MAKQTKKKHGKEALHEELAVPDKVQAGVTGTTITIKGPKGEVSRSFRHPSVIISYKDNKLVLDSNRSTKREKKLLYTIAAHIKNIFKGVTEGHYYELKICAAHFPMNVTVSGRELIVKNFLGENFPRKLLLQEGVNVKVNGDVIRIESSNKELAGTTASDIEILTIVRNRDRRIFQDGIFITNKDGKKV